MSRLLLVDDHAVVREGLRTLLNKAGWSSVEEAAGIGEARLKLHAVDMIILDLALGEEDGLDFAAEVRRSHPGLRVLVLTMSSNPRTVRAAIRAGVDGYALKQDTPAELLTAVSAVSQGSFYLAKGVAAPVLADLRSTGEPVKQTRHQTILEALAQGRSNQEIADMLNLSLSSVKAHLRELFAEYGVKDRMSLVLRVRGGLSGGESDSELL